MKLKELIEQYGEYEVKNGFMELLEEPKPKTVYDLKDGDWCFFLTESGTIMKGIWRDDSGDHNRIRLGNVFLTKEDAEFTVERLKVIAELKKYAKEFSDEEWLNQSIVKHYIIFDYEDHVINIGYVCFTKVSDIYFESEEKAQEAIKAVGEDRIKKYYLGVKE